MSAAVSIADVSFAFGTVSIVRNVSFSCAQGSTTAILGRSGAGKTTLLNLIAGLLVPDDGTVKVLERAPRWATSNQRIGYFFQRPTLFPWASAAENVALPLQLRRGHSAHREERVHRAMARAKILEAADKFPSELSGGMQTRVALARALVHDPEILLLDEPFAALDDMVREEIYAELRELLLDGQRTAILVTHNLIEALVLADIILICGRTEDGQVGSTLLAKYEVKLPRSRDTAIVATPEFGEAYTDLRQLMRGTR